MKYDYVKVDPRAIQMLGGDAQDLLNEGLDGDLPESALQSFNETLLSDDMVSAEVDGSKVTVLDKDEDILKQILNELKEIKVILAGK